MKGRKQGWQRRLGKVPVNGRMWELGDQSGGVMVGLTVETLQASIVSFVFHLLGADVKVLKPLQILVSVPLIST